MKNVKERLLHLVLALLCASSGQLPLSYNTELEINDTSETFTNKRGKRGGGGRGALASALDPVELFLGFAIIIVAIYILAGGTTGSVGIFGNATAANKFRDAGVTIASFASLVGLLLAVAIIRKIR